MRATDVLRALSHPTGYAQISKLVLSKITSNWMYLDLQTGSVKMCVVELRHELDSSGQPVLDDENIFPKIFPFAPVAGPSADSSETS